MLALETGVFALETGRGHACGDTAGAVACVYMRPRMSMSVRMTQSITSRVVRISAMNI